MEALRELERVQKMVSSMHAHDNNESTRFLADFFLFIVKPYGTLDMKKKFTLISEITPKIYPDFLQEEQVLFSCDGQDEQFSSRYLTEHCVNNESNLSKREEMPMIGLDAMQRANSTLEDFCRSYFMFHGMDVNKPESVFRHLPVLSFTESYIYQLDSFNEELVNISGKISVGNTSNTEKNKKLADHIVKAFQTGALRPLIFVLERHGLMTDRIRVELSFGEEYWALERKLCHALVSRKKISIEDVMRAIHLKSFDYRVLSLLLYQLKETQVNEMHMDFLSISEFLVEVSDDLFDYEDDVIDNNFNILRMFVGVYGASVAPMMLAKYITEAEEKYENLSKTLDPDLFINYMRRCEEATKEGGSGAGHSLGTWSIPPVIANEDFYRSERLTSNSVDSSPD